MASTPMSMPWLHFVGVGPGGDVLQPFGGGFGVDRRGGGAVTGILGRLAGHFFDHLGLMFSKVSSSSISLATVTPSLVTVGVTKGFFKDHHTAGGTEGALHRFGKFAGRHAACVRGRRCRKQFLLRPWWLPSGTQCRGAIRGQTRGPISTSGVGPRGSRQSISKCRRLPQARAGLATTLVATFEDQANIA